MTMTWHADQTLLAAYGQGALDGVRAGSLEAHLMSCDRCREELAVSVPAPSLDRIWHGVEEAIDSPRLGIVERVLIAVRVPDHVSRLLAVTMSLRASWLVAEVAALGFAVVAANGATGRQADLALFLFLMVAAMLPVAGVAVAFGPGIDPTHDIALAAPMRADRLLLMRAAAVLAASIAITAIAAIALPGLDAIAAAWLLPAFGLTMATLVLGTWLHPFAAAASVTLAWAGVAAAAAIGTQDRFAAFRPEGQVAWAVAIAVLAALLFHRHSAYEEGIAR